jgi:hypothetical protein
MMNWRRAYKSFGVLRNIFPRSIRMASNSAAAPPALSSSQNVTLPVIPELYDPNFLDILIPASLDKRAPDHVKAPISSNPMVDALKSTAHRVFTENNAPAYDSSLSATLDAFDHINNHTFGQEVNQYLAKAWEEDPELTLRIIWNLRSIPDGKAAKEAFYRSVFFRVSKCHG